MSSKKALEKLLVERIMCWIDPECSHLEFSEINSWKVPLRFRKFSGTLYRGLSLSKEEFESFKETGRFSEKGMSFQSWTTSPEVAERFARDTDGDYSIILKYEPNPSEVHLDISSVLQDQEFSKIARKVNPQSWAYIQEVAHEDEVILQSPAITFKNVLLQKKWKVAR